jgi:hypothetical protein
MRVGFLRVDMLEFPIQNKVGAEGAQGDGDVAAKERVREDRSVLWVQAVSRELEGRGRDAPSLALRRGTCRDPCRTRRRTRRWGRSGRRRVAW